MQKRSVGAIAIAFFANSLWAASYYTARLEDPTAVYLNSGEFGVHGDGLADDTASIQRAIDKVQETVRQGVVFVPEGRYRLTATVNVWPGVRLIGYGSKRPVFLIASNTPGYQDKDHENYLVFFAGSRPRAGATGRPPDATPGTFYSAMSNIDVEIGDGNPGAVGVRGTYAQHCFLAHMDFRIGPGIAGVHDTGNVMEDVRFFGGQYGIWTRTPSPSWQFTAVDAYFEGQREAAIRERLAGLTLIRPHFRKVPSAVSIDAGQADNLWIRDGRMEEITGPAVAIGVENNPRNQINMENVTCRDVPQFATFRPSGRMVKAPAPRYEVKVFSHGLHYDEIGGPGEMRNVFEAISLDSLPQPVESDLTPLPPTETWVNVRSMGAHGDGRTDDTSVFAQAIAQHRAIYVPAGKYVISDTLTLRPDTVLIGLHPGVTQLYLLDRTPAFQGPGSPKAMIEAPQGGTNIVIGIGLNTNGINPRALCAKWMAGTRSMMNDVRFHGGHGTSPWPEIYNNAHTADPDLARRWDAQYPSLWVTNGGGGTFFDLWTPSTFAQAGMLVSDTSTEGRVYEMSSEHHVRYEVQVHNASNWRFYALQTEEERGESGFALPLEIDGSSNITVANMNLYRVISSFQPFPYAIRVSNSSNIRFRNIHCYTNSKAAFASAIYDETHNAELRQRDFASITVSGNPPAGRRGGPSALLATGAKVEKLAGGFFNAAGGAVSPEGDYFFVDAYRQRIYRWSEKDRRVSMIRDNPLDPINLAFDKAGNLIVVSYAGNGTVYAFRPDSSGLDVQILKGVEAEPPAGATAILPVSDYSLRGQQDTGPAKRAYRYVSPDGTTFVSARDDFATGAMNWGVKSADVLRSFGLARAAPGQPFYITTESEMTTWRATVTSDGNLTDLTPFVQQGGESIAIDRSGNVYLAAGQIYVYTPAGKLIDTIEVPERPSHIAFGGSDRRTLFIATPTSLYSVRTRVAGR